MEEVERRFFAGKVRHRGYGTKSTKNPVARDEAASPSRFHRLSLLLFNAIADQIMQIGFD